MKRHRGMEKPPLIGLVLDNFAVSLPRAVSGAGFGADENRRKSSLRGLQCSGELEAVTRKNAIVMIGSRDGRWRIFGARLHIADRRQVQTPEKGKLITRAPTVSPQK